MNGPEAVKFMREELDYKGVIVGELTGHKYCFSLKDGQ
jgi:hypothetical protein